MKNRKQIGRKSGGMILAYKESLENYIELLDIESKYVLWFKVSSVKSCSCSFISKSIKSGSSAVLLLKSPNKEMYL
jgi:tRNA-binding EMAP/Myf-like protein